MSESAQSSGSGTVEYIQHHLTNICVGDCDPITHKASGFMSLHLDTMFFSFGLAALMIIVAARLGKNLNADKPGGFQNFVEMIVDFVAQQVKDTFPGHNSPANMLPNSRKPKLNGLANSSIAVITILIGTKNLPNGWNKNDFP